MVRTLLRLGQRLGIRVAAEGVVEERQLHWLREEGCAEASGDLLCGSLAADEISSWMVERSIDDRVFSRWSGAAPLVADRR